MDPRWRGMSYQQLSREAASLIQAAHHSGYWTFLPQQLADIRTLMRERSSPPDPLVMAAVRRKINSGCRDMN